MGTGEDIMDEVKVTGSRLLVEELILETKFQELVKKNMISISWENFVQ